MTEQLLDRLKADASHHQPAREGVAAVVEVEVFQLRSFHGTLKRGPNTASPEYLSLMRSR